MKKTDELPIACLPEVDSDPDYRPGQILELLPRIMAEVGGISKDKVQQGFKYRGIDDVYNALHPLFHKHGVTIVPQVMDVAHDRTTSSNGVIVTYCTMRVRYRFYAPDGSYLTCIASGEGSDRADKASNKAMSAALKYALFQTFLIPTEDQPDADAQTIEVAAPKPAAKAAPPKDPIIAKINADISRMKNDKSMVWPQGMMSGFEQRYKAAYGDIASLTELRDDIAKEYNALNGGEAK